MPDWGSVPVFGVRPPGGSAVVRPSAYGVIRGRGGRVAVVEARGGLFLPGGGIEPGETPARAIEREALEECGLEVALDAWRSHAVELVHAAAEATWFEKRSTFASGEALGAAGGPREQAHALRWMTVEEAAGRLSPESHRWALDRWRRASA